MERRALNDMDIERHKHGIWYVAGSMPLLVEVRQLVLERLHRCSLLVILLLDVLIVAAAFACAAALVPRESNMVVSTRHCVDFVSIPGLEGPQQNNDTWFQSWKVDREDFVCMTVQPNTDEISNRDFFRNLFIGGKLHESFQMPIRRNRTLVRFNRGQRYIKGYLTIVLEMPENRTERSDASIWLRLGGRDGGGGGGSADWDQLGTRELPLPLNTCQSRTVQLEDNSTEEHCVLNQRLFETPSLDRQFYLLNARVKHMRAPPLSMALVLVFQRRLYTLVCLNIQACFVGVLTLLSLLLLWRCRSVYRRVPSRHRLLLLLALALLVWDVPVGYAALDVDLPWLSLLDAVRMDLFYLVFLAFCLVMVAEQALFSKRPVPSGWYACLLLPLTAGVLLLLALDVVHLSSLLEDVFWTRPCWLRVCVGALLAANAVYVLLLALVAAVRCCRPAVRRRYRMLAALTCLTAAAACTELAERRESENGWFWAWTDTRPTGGHLLYVGMLVWYNVFVATLLILYIPTRPLIEASEPLFDYERKVPLADADDDSPAPITRNGADDQVRQPILSGDDP